MVNNIPGSQYTLVNVDLLAIEAGGLAGDALLDAIKPEKRGIKDEGSTGCVQPFHSHFGPCGPKVNLPGINQNGTIDF
jgi:hypothetical protein